MEKIFAERFTAEEINNLTAFFEFETLNSLQLLICIAIGFISVVWFEIVKLIKRVKQKQTPLQKP